jgi:hypothetical protein
MPNRDSKSRRKQFQMGIGKCQTAPVEQYLGMV